ncbi:MAG: hypothetical protein K6G00_12080 [Treponema sp.]|nr:hypothetical protein [Treponema sp.]
MFITKKSKALVAIAVCASAAFLSGCKKKAESTVKTYTYRTTSTAPSTWSPTDYQQGDEGAIFDYASDSLYRYVLNESRDGYETICSMATEFPIDVTADYAGNATYNIPENAEKGYAWKFNIRDDLKWQDGTPITAATFEYSLKQFLNPQMKNYRASSYYSDNIVIANAENYYNGQTDWENVGFVKNNDYSYTLVLSVPLSEFLAIYNSPIPLVKEDLYEANKKQSGDIIKSTYGTDIDKFSSYGPYKISEYQADKYIKYDRNENWFGWNAFKDKNYFQTTNIYIQFILEHTTNLNLFLQGKLDDVGLSSVDMDKYGNSEYRIITPTTYTVKMSFNIDKKSLKDEESDGINHSIISYKDFRHAVSLAIDREKYVSTIVIGSDPGFGLFTNAYICDPETNLKYRESEQAKKMLCDFYETSSISDITGFNKEKAKEYFQKAYEQALKNGDLKASDKVQIDLHMTVDNESLKRACAFIQESINNATEGTDLENKVNLKFIVDENYYENMRQGKVDLAMTLWGGATYAPYKMLACYCDPGTLNEYGFYPKKETCTINVNGKDVTNTLYDWYMELNAGSYADAGTDTKNHIFASVEKKLLSYYNMIPLYYQNSSGLISQRIIQGADHYINPLVGYGGLEELKYSMDDEEWEGYCNKNNYQLKY